MLTTNITVSNHNFESSLSNSDMDYSSDFQNSEFSIGLNNSKFPYFIQEFDFLSKKKNRVLSPDEEPIDQGFKKVFIEDKENEEKDFVQNTSDCEKKPNIIKEETEFNQLSLNEKKQEIEKRETGRQKCSNINLKKEKFTVKIKMTPGPKRKNKKEDKVNKKIHSKNNFDNIITHVQVNFIKFIINLSNDILSSEFEKDKELRFKDISYSIKKKINLDYFESLKNSSIKKMILNPISQKFKKINENHNEKIYNKVITSAKWLNEFFNMNYLTFFRKYYFNKYYRLNQISIKDKIIKLSNKTNTFYELYEKSNEERKKILIKYINRAYFNIQETVEENNSKTVIFYASK